MIYITIIHYTSYYNDNVTRMKMECQRQSKSIFQSQSTQQNNTSALELACCFLIWFLSTFVAMKKWKRKTERTQRELLHQPNDEN